MLVDISNFNKIDEVDFVQTDGIDDGIYTICFPEYGMNLPQECANVEKAAKAFAKYRILRLIQEPVTLHFVEMEKTIIAGMNNWRVTYKDVSRHRSKFT